MWSDQHLSRMSTCWTLVRQAHGAKGAGASAAQLELLKRYGDVAHRYLLGALRDPEAADELSQEFALRFIRGDFSGLDPAKGRFRDYIKTVLFRLAANHQQEQGRRPRPLPAQVALPVVEADADAGFLASWRQELLDRAWKSLQGRNTAYFALLRLRLEEPDLPAALLAGRLGRQVGKTFTADSVRKTLQRAREKFADLLLDEVAFSLEDPSRRELERELRELGLLAYCQPAREMV